MIASYYERAEWQNHSEKQNLGALIRPFGEDREFLLNSPGYILSFGCPAPHSVAGTAQTESHQE